MTPPPQIRWRVALSAPPETAWALLATDAGRARFWAEEAPEVAGRIRFRFPDGSRLVSEVLEREAPRRLALSYFEGSTVTFTVEAREGGGSVLTVEERGLSPAGLHENRAGWVSVLLALKAAADFGVDLRNHDPELIWERGFVDN